nr:hypothetical protein Iba_chr12fCG2190 [Ipomoea batatas]
MEKRASSRLNKRINLVEAPFGTVVRLRQFMGKEFLVMATLENFQQQLCNSNRAILNFLLQQFQSGRQQVCSSAAKNFLGACEFILVSQLQIPLGLQWNTSLLQ